MLQQKPPVGLNYDVCNPVLLPNYVAFEHPSTKWLLNTFRNGATNRLIAMLKEKPILFRRIYQIFDVPSEVLADPSDTQSMFNSNAVLYLRPLSLAVYMRCRSAVQLLLNSSLCSPMEYGYASDVYIHPGRNPGGDLLEILPVCIAIRRQFLDILPLLFRFPTNPNLPVYSPRTSFTIRYVNKRVDKVTTYTDVFHYATELAQVNRHVNIVKLLEVLVDRCTGFYAVGRLDEMRNSHLHSLFRRLVYIGLFVDTESRIASPLIQCMNFLIRRAHFRPCSSADNTLFLSFNDVQTAWKDMNEWARDCYITISLLFLLCITLRQRAKVSVAMYAVSALFRALLETHMLDSVLSMSAEQLSSTVNFIIKQDRCTEELGRENIGLNSQIPNSRINTATENPTLVNNTCRSSHSILTSWSNLNQVLDKLHALKKLNLIKQTHLFNIAGRKRIQFNEPQFSRHGLTLSHPDGPPVRGDGIVSSHTNVADKKSLIKEVPSFWHADQSVSRQKVAGDLEEERESSSPTDTDAAIASCFVRIDSNASGRCLMAPTKNNKESYPFSKNLACVNQLDFELDTAGTSPEIFHRSLVDFPDQNTNELGDSFNTNEPIGAGDDPIQCRKRIRKGSVPSSLAHQSSLYKSLISDHSGLRCRRSISAILVRSPSIEYLSLREFDQFIDCITSSALSSERGMDGQLIEEILKEYLDHGIFSSRVLSRANSVIGTQVFREYDEELNTLNLESWTITAETTCNATPGDENVKARKNRRPMLHDIPASPSLDCNIIQDLSTKSQAGNHSDENIKRSVQTSPTSTLDITKESIKVTSPMTSPSVHEELEQNKRSRWYLWSCAKPISQLNTALNVLKQHMSSNRRSAVQTKRKVSSKAEIRSCV